MKKTIALAVLIIGIVLIGLNKRPADDGTLNPPHQASEQAALPSPSPEPTVETKSSEIQNKNDGSLERIQQEIAQLSEQLSEVEQELKMAGFPKVMLDERLSESERELLLEKLQKAGDLQTRIASLRIRKIDMETEKK